MSSSFRTELVASIDCVRGACAREVTSCVRTVLVVAVLEEVDRFVTEYLRRAVVQPLAIFLVVELERNFCGHHRVNHP